MADQKELDGIFERAQHEDIPDVEAAYATHKEAGGFALDLNTDKGRTDYMRERLLEQHREDPDPYQAPRAGHRERVPLDPDARSR